MMWDRNLAPDKYVIWYSLDLTLVCLLDDLQLAVHVTFKRFDAGVRWLFGAVHHERPFFQRAAMFTFALEPNK